MGHYFLDTQYVALKRIPVWKKMEIFEPPLVLEFVAKLQSLQNTIEKTKFSLEEGISTAWVSNFQAESLNTS